MLLPSHLFLTIHESIAHPTELDPIFGFEANYAGTSFISPVQDYLGKFRFGPDNVSQRAWEVREVGVGTVSSAPTRVRD